MAAEAVIRFAVILAAAMTIAAVPASAQTNDTTGDQTKIDCRNGTNAAGADCAKDNEKDGAGAARPGAVFLPALIVDLFPNPAETPVPVPTPAPRQDPGTPPAAPADTQPGTSAGGPIVSPTDLIAVQPQRAVVGDFVPDEVLVTVDGDAGAVQQIAASFGLQSPSGHVRTLRLASANSLAEDEPFWTDQRQSRQEPGGSTGHDGSDGYRSRACRPGREGRPCRRAAPVHASPRAGIPLRGAPDGIGNDG